MAIIKESSISRKRRFLIGPAALDCNRGDQALTWEAIDLLRQLSPNCEIAIMSDFYDDPDDKQSLQTRSLGITVIPSLLFNPRRAAHSNESEVFDSGWSLLKMKIRALLDFLQSQFLLVWAKNHTLARLLLGRNCYDSYGYLRSCDALVIKGGGYIYAYRGLRWAYYIWFCLFPLMLAQGCGVNVIILPNSFGPFQSGWGKWLVRRVLRRCTLVTAREPKSFEVLNNIIPGKVELFPDMAFNLRPADCEWAKAELMSQRVALGDKPCVGITMRPWRFPNAVDPHAKYEKYVQAFGRLCEYLLEKGYMPVLFAHTTGPHAHENDSIALKDTLQATSAADRVFYIDGDYNCRQLKSLYGFMDFMICTRFHSAIFSIAQQVPCLAVSYQGYKATGIMEEIGLGDFTIAIEDVDDKLLIEKFERLVANQQVIKHKMSSYVICCQQKLKQLECFVVSKIKEMSGGQD